jgi:hypothetical protein
VRLALLPIIGFKNVQGESDYILYRNMVRDFAALGKSVFSYFCLPRIAFGQGTNEPGLVNVYTEGPTDPADRGGFHDMLATPSLTFLDLFAPRNCLYPIDVVVTSRTDAVPMLARWLWDWRAGRETIPVIVVDPQVCNVPISDRNETWLLNRTLGYTMGWPVFNTENELNLALQAASKYLLPSLVRKLEERARVVVSSNVDFGDLDRVLRQVSRSELFTLFFGGRLNVAKRADVMLKLFDEFYRFGRDVDIVVCSPKVEARIVVPPQVRLLTSLKRAEFIAEAARAHVYLNTSKAEGFSAGFVEQVYLIPVSIVPNLPWVQSTLGEMFERHPFVYDSFDEARAMLRWVYEHFEEACEKCWPVREYLRREYDNRLVAGEMMAVIEGVIQACRRDFKLSAGQSDLLWRALKGMEERFGFERFWKALCDKGAAATRIPQLGWLWRWQAYVWLTEHVTDLCDAPEPVFEQRH